MKKIQILIVDDISDTRQSIRRLLEFEQDIEVIGEASSGSEAILFAEVNHPDIILMDINMPEMDGIRTTELLAQRASGSSVIIMSVQGEQAYLRSAMMAGAREYIVKPFTGNELGSIIARVYEADQKKKVVLGDSIKPVIPVKEHAGQIISFFSTKGGVGKTTLATNLAVQLAGLGKWRVLLLDLNLQFGDVAVFLNLSPKRSIADAAQAGNLKYAEIQSCLLTHSSGLQVLTAPTRPEYAELVSAEHVEQILGEVKPYFDFIICDNVSRFDDISLLSFDAADQIWLVLTLDIPTIKNTKLSLEVIEGLNHTPKIRTVLNSVSKDSEISVKEVEKSLNRKIDYEVPSDARVLMASLNQGEPFVRTFPQSKASDAIRKMAVQLTSSDAEADPNSTGQESVNKSNNKRSFAGLRRVLRFES